jgi:hypothetical protein
MLPLKAEETLHNYLRRYFEKISKDNARQFVEQKEALPSTSDTLGNSRILPQS